jgi:hypothetical protein
MPSRRPFPRDTVENALHVARVIKEKNGGNPWETAEVAKALGVAQTNNRFFYQTAASRDYGFTIGTRDAAQVSLTDLGREAVYPTGPDSEYEAQLQGFLNIEVFAQVLDHFGGSKLPEKRFLSNTLETKFNVDKDYHDEFVEIFSANCRFLGIGATWNRSARTPRASRDPESESVTIASPTGDADAPVLSSCPLQSETMTTLPGSFPKYCNKSSRLQPSLQDLKSKPLRDRAATLSSRRSSMTYSAPTSLWRI